MNTLQSENGAFRCYNIQIKKLIFNYLIFQKKAKKWIIKEKYNF